MREILSPALKNITMRSLPHKFEIVIPPKDINCDPACMRSLAQGDRVAYTWLYKNLSRKVYNYAFLMTKNETQSEDIVQEVFLKIWNKREIFNVVTDYNGYLYMLYKNHVLDFLKSQQREARANQQYYSNSVDASMQVDEILFYKESRALIAASMDKLPKQRKLVFKLSREYGWKHARIAGELKISPCTVKAHLGQALKFLKKDIAERSNN